MLKNKGVYTTKCPTCTRLILMHVLSDGSISPDKCPECELEFASIDKGEQRNTFVITAKTNTSKYEEKEEDTDLIKITKKDNADLIKITRKDNEDLIKINRTDKRRVYSANKKSLKW